MKKLLLILLTLTTAATFAQVRVNLNSNWAVTFPVKPIISKPDTATTIYTSNLNGAYYIATVKKLNNLPDITFNFDSLDHFYDALVNTTIKNSSATLSVKQTITLNDKRAISFGYTLPNSLSFPDTREQQSVYLNKVLVSFSFWTFKNKLDANMANKEVFFNSIGKPSAVAPEAKYNTTVTAGDSSKTTSSTSTKTTTAASEHSSPIYTIIGIIVGLLLGFGYKTIRDKKRKQKP
jgi:hypothetical protein